MNGNFKGIWIPKEILCNKNLGQTEKLLISSILRLIVVKVVMRLMDILLRY